MRHDRLIRSFEKNADAAEPVAQADSLRGPTKSSPSQAISLRHWLTVAVLLLAGCSSAPEPKKEAAAPKPARTSGAPDVYKVQFVTSKGPLVIEVHREWAPIGADHFYELVKAG